MLIRAIKTTKLIRKGMSTNEKDLVLWYDRRKDVLSTYLNECIRPRCCRWGSKDNI
jgi:hypothetical protein